MKLRKLLILPIVLAFFSLLTACVTVAKFEARMDAKKGLNKAQLIEEMESQIENILLVTLKSLNTIKVKQV